MLKSKSISSFLLLITLFSFLSTPSGAQDESLPPVDLERLKARIGTLRTTELVMSMSQRSLIMPAYLTELKALIAKQAYNFWSGAYGEPYVSHLNVYSALHEAYKAINYDSAMMKAYNQVGFHNNSVTSIEFGSDPNAYYSSSKDGRVIKWNLDDPGGSPEIIYESDHIIKTLDISDDGRWLMAVFYQTGMALISTEQRFGNDAILFEDPEAVQTAIFIPNEQKYLSVTRKGELKVKGFHVKTEQVGHTNNTVTSLQIDPEQGNIYAGTMEGILESWDEASYFGYKVGSFPIICLDISPDGKLLAVGRERGDVVLWSIENNRLERVIQGHQSAVTDLEFSPDSQFLLTTSRDKTARIWELSDSRKLPIVMDDHEDWVLTGCFDPSGEYVITGSKDQLIRKWPTKPQMLAERICLFLERNLSKEEWEEFVGTDIPYQKTCVGIE